MHSGLAEGLSLSDVMVELKHLRRQVLQPLPTLPAYSPDASMAAALLAACASQTDVGRKNFLPI